MEVNDLLTRALRAFNVIPNTRFFYDDKKTSTYEIASEIEQHLRTCAKSKDVFERTDWGLLREQKTTLALLQAKDDISNEEVETIEGVLNLLDAIQDYAKDDLGIHT